MRKVLRVSHPARLVAGFFLCPITPLEPLDNLPAVLQEPDMVAVLLQCASVRDFIRDNFGLYHPPGDYRALRAENLRRTEISRRSPSEP